MGRNRSTKKALRNRGFKRSRRQHIREVVAARMNRNRDREANLALDAAILLNAPDQALQANVFQIDQPMESNVRPSTSEPQPASESPSVSVEAEPVSESPVRQVLLPTFSSTPRHGSTVGPSRKSPYPVRRPERQHDKKLRQATLTDFMSDWERRRDQPATTPSPEQHQSTTPPLQTPPSASVSEDLPSENESASFGFEAPRPLSDTSEPHNTGAKKRDRGQHDLLLTEAMKFQPKSKKRRMPQDQHGASSSQASLDDALLNKDLPKPPAGEF